MCSKDPVTIVALSFNFICFIAGIAQVILGVLYELPYYELSDTLPPEYIFLRWIPVALIVVGGIVILITALECFAMIRKKRGLLIANSILFLVIFVAQIAVGAFAFISINNPKDLHQKIDTSLNTIFVNARENHETLPAYTIQETFQCCGREGPDFWSEPPSSCYAEEVIHKNNLYKKGCVREVTNFVKTSARIMAIVTLGISLTQIICSCLGFYLAKNIKNNQSIQTYKFRFRH